MEIEDEKVKQYWKEITKYSYIGKKKMNLSLGAYTKLKEEAHQEKKLMKN